MEFLGGERWTSSLSPKTVTRMQKHKNIAQYKLNYSATACSICFVCLAYLQETVSLWCLRSPHQSHPLQTGLQAVREDEGVKTERRSEEAAVEKEMGSDSHHPLCGLSCAAAQAVCCFYAHLSVGSSEVCWFVHSEDQRHEYKSNNTSLILKHIA